jgi:hypothetical protein
MHWWKIGVYASAVWGVLMVILAGFMLWFISSHPMGANLDDARSRKAGEAVGMLMGDGFAAIWAYAFIRLRTRSHC